MDKLRRDPLGSSVRVKAAATFLKCYDDDAHQGYGTTIAGLIKGYPEGQCTLLGGPLRACAFRCHDTCSALLSPSIPDSQPLKPGEARNEPLTFSRLASVAAGFFNI